MKIKPNFTINQSSFLRGMTAVLLLLSGLLHPCGLYAQEQITVRGTVTDSLSGEPLTGVSVTQKGTNNGAATDAQGKFAIQLDRPDAVLLFSSIGYKVAEYPVGSTAELQVSLEFDALGLEQVVVVGYGTKQKKDLMGSVAVVDVAAMQKQPASSITNQLQGRAAGVTVIGSGRPGEEPQVRIRGFNTFGNNAPLYVVDGVPLQSIASLNPNDVASMQVLKDAGAASIYGSRAANGVIIVTTKSGGSRISVSYDGYYGSERPKKGNVWDLLSPTEMAELKWMADPSKRSADPQYGNGATPRLPDYISPAGRMEGEVDHSLYNVDPRYTDPESLNGFYRIVKANQAGTNWYEEIFRPAPITSHNVSVSGGGDRSTFLFSLNHFDQQGTLINTYVKRQTLRANSQFKIGDRVRVGENMAVSISNQMGGGGNAIMMAFRQQPIIPVRDIMGNYAGSFGSDLGNALNPVAIQERTKNNRNKGNRLLGSMHLEADILSNFTFRTQFGGELYAGYSHQFGYPEYENSANENTVNSYSEQSSYGYNWTWTNTLRYEATIADIHQLTAVAGVESYKNEGRNLSGSTQGYFSFDPDFTTLSTGSGTQTNASSRWADALFSTFARVDYNLMQRYLVGATIRRDGSSRFLNYQYGWFPAASAAWRISEEPFWDIAWMSDFKLRGSYGVMGNQMNVAPDNAFTTFTGNRYASFYDINGSGNGIEMGFQRGRVGNPDAKWERNINANIGFDAVFFGGKLDVTADYYRKDVVDLLYNPQLPGTAGTATSPFVNIAQMTNQGIDLAVNTSLPIGDQVKFNGQLTFTTYRNEIVKVSDDAQYFEQDSRRFSGAYIVRNGVGTSIGQFYGYQIDGFWNTQEEITAANAGAPGGTYQAGMGLGRFRYADRNNDGLVNASDRTFLGNPSPDFSYGLNLAVEYRQFDFSMFLFGVSGNDVWNQLKWWHDFYPTFGGAKSRTALHDSWTPTRHQATAPIQEVNATFSTSQVPNSYYVENGSYLRAKNAQLGYTLPDRACSRLGIRNLRLYVAGTNLFTITGYSGTDPEIPGGNTSFGIDEGIYPAQRQYLLGLTFTY
ncbi:SusC/RagA family TonB-linked outer membrane protein [Parapedobacter pyrenivorans]|uniref:SusC/RagA family TonB-linked outer membrane protein n=1 Tax=Parapedobacter pyrenivorans TaxID=1305674 RepID=A0A917MGA8_9SPHI|nr:TonB-dependent receptor [Parapedobacter pyrenivorans]GGG99657.1 SusC/RagA family TonB-linked outer membrane protein [Parapedobacter pyrenivorans]